MAKRKEKDRRRCDDEGLQKRKKTTTTTREEDLKVPVLLRAVYGRRVCTVREAIRRMCEAFESQTPKSVMKNLEDKERDSMAYTRGVLEKSFIVLPERLPPLVMRSSDEDERRAVSSPPAIGRRTAKERVATVQKKFFSARQKPNNALCFGLTRFAKGRDQRNCVNSAEAFATSTHWGTLWDRIGDEMAEWLMLYASGFASLTSSTTTVSNAMRSVRPVSYTHLTLPTILRV